MIDESIGKILGMAMAYGVSSLGLFLAYANYRKRTLKADKVMTPKAWGVVAAVLLTIIGGVFVVAELAKPPTEAEPEQETVAESVTEPAPVPDPDSEELARLDFEDGADVSPQDAAATEAAVPEEERSRWPLIGMLLPALIFLAATWITAGLYRHFSAADGTGDRQPSRGPESVDST